MDSIVYWVIVWVVGLIISAGVAYAAHRWLRLPKWWAVALGVIIFVVLNLPIKTHAIKLDMPRSSN